jgi:2-polyprenyl-3-methyl-5-hydroxy-6-metoxy-1,4-benzoquinol methylase
MNHCESLPPLPRDRDGYLRRMAKPLQDKLRVAAFIPPTASRVLDVGCADGTVTTALAHIFPETRFLGIDLSQRFITRAKAQTDTPNLGFRRCYLRDLLEAASFEQYDVITFISVLHEFYSYGSGMASVLKALADAHQLLKPNGVLIIRDMILPETSDCDDPALAEKIAANPAVADQLRDFTHLFGPITSRRNANHFLLKYLYRENWATECKEHYVPVSIEQYRAIFALLDMKLYETTYLLPFLREKWQHDFNLTEQNGLYSTTLFVAQKLGKS